MQTLNSNPDVLIDVARRLSTGTSLPQARSGYLPRIDLSYGKGRQFSDNATTEATYGGAIALTAAIVNERPMAEMLFTGPSQEISGKAYSQAKGMIAADREGYLQSRFLVRDHVQTIVDR